MAAVGGRGPRLFPRVILAEMSAQGGSVLFVCWKVPGWMEKGWEKMKGRFQSISEWSPPHFQLTGDLATNRLLIRHHHPATLIRVGLFTRAGNRVKGVEWNKLPPTQENPLICHQRQTENNVESCSIDAVLVEYWSYSMRGQRLSCCLDGSTAFWDSNTHVQVWCAEF